MLLIEDNKIIQVDSSSDVLQHFGVKGMKWGMRRVHAKNQRNLMKSNIKSAKSSIKSAEQKYKDGKISSDKYGEIYNDAKNSIKRAKENYKVHKNLNTSARVNSDLKKLSNDDKARYLNNERDARIAKNALGAYGATYGGIMGGIGGSKTGAVIGAGVGYAAGRALGSLATNEARRQFMLSAQEKNKVRLV